MRRSIVLGFILVLTASSLIIVESVWAQATLSVPEFTIKYADYSYDVPASTSIDPFTGKTVENPVYHVDNRTLTFTIKNQIVRDGNLHYIIRMKGHFSENWTGIFDGIAIENSLSTVWVFSTSGKGGLYLYGQSFNLPPVGQVDFQVKAQTWGEIMATTSPQNPFGGSITTLFAESDWSSTQTITIPEPLPSESPSSTPTQTPVNQSPSPSPSIPEFPIWIGLTGLLPGTILAFLLMVKTRHLRKMGQNNRSGEGP